jgi:hypothetical protein
MELLNKTESEFDPDFALLSQDIKVKEEEDGTKKIEVRLKCPNENRSGKEVIVNIFESNGTLCPLKALGFIDYITLQEHGLAC